MSNEPVGFSESLLDDIPECESCRELQSQLAASEEARKKAEAETAKVRREAADYSADKAIKAKEVMEQNYLAWMAKAKELEQRAEAAEQRILDLESKL